MALGTDAATAQIGIIGGSGLHAIAHDAGCDEVVLETPWGSPSGPYRGIL